MGKQAVEAKRLNAFAVDPSELIIVGLDTKDGPEHPLYDKRVKLPVDENLAKDMLMNGFRGAIEVRKNGEKLEVVYGRQRVRAARLANEWATERGREAVFVSCFVKKGSDADFLGIRIGENVHRRGLSVLDMADECKRFMDMGRTEDEAAVTFGMTPANIRNLMKLHDLDTQVRRAVEAEELSPSAAAALSGLSREEQREKLGELREKAASGEKITKRTAKKAAKSKNGQEATIAPPKRLVTNILKLDKRHGGVLSDDFRKGVLWMLGEVGSASIKGMRDLEKEVEDLKQSRKSKKGKEARV